MRNSFIKELSNEAKKDKSIMIVAGDLGFGVLKEFYEDMPNQYINGGIAEQNMCSVAAALGMENKKPYLYSIGNFDTLRCLEQIRNNVLYHNSNVKIISVGSGFGYGPMGATHHATEDLGILRCLPGLTVFTPSDPEEARQIALLTTKMNTAAYVRLGKGNEPMIHDKPFTVEIGKAIEIIKGNEVAIFVAGPGSDEGLKAAQDLNKQGISTGLYSFPTVKPIDEQLIHDCFDNYKLVITVEEHNIIGGFDSAIAEVAVKKQHKAVLYPVGLNDEFSSTVGKEEYLKKVYKIDSDSIIEIVKKVLEGLK